MGNKPVGQLQKKKPAGRKAVSKKMAVPSEAELFFRGDLQTAYRYFGCHPDKQGGQDGYRFRVWAPHAKSVRLVGDFNG